MRIRIIRPPVESCIDSTELERFEVDREYEVGTTLACVILSEGWGEPVEAVAAAGADVPFSERDLLAPKPYRDADSPLNLIREHYPPYLDEERAAAADLMERRRRPRSSKSRLK